METKIFTQTKGKTDAKKAAEYIDEQSNAKLAIIYSSIRNDEKTKEYFKYLADNLKTPFLALRVGGTYTLEDGYCEEAVSIVVFCGELDVTVFDEKIDFKNPQKTAENITPNLKDKNLAFIYSATYAKQLSVMDYILRIAQEKHPKTQILGGGSAPKPIVATKNGVFEDSIVLAAVNGLEYNFNIDTGFTFDETKKERYVVTKSDDFYVYEINNRNAIEEYSKLLHIRPYFFNKFSILLSKPSPGVIGSLARTNPVLYEAIMKTTVEIYGTKRLDEELIRPFGLIEIDEENDRLVFENKKPENTELRRLIISKQNQLGVYDKLVKQYHNTSFLLLTACIFTPFWFGFDFEEVGRRLAKLKQPFLLYFVFGEFGAKLPYKEDINVVNTCVVETLALED